MKMTDVSIRYACQDDLAAMIALLQTLFAIEADFVPEPDRQRRGLTRLLDEKPHQRCILVAETDDQVIGMATLQVLISTAEGGSVGLVEDVVVDENYRGFGVGRKLVDALASWSVEHGLTRMQLLADQTNRQALGFYQKMGWQFTQLICLRQNEFTPKGT